MSTKTKNSSWKLKWYSSFHRKVSKKNGDPHTYFSVPTEMAGKFCTMCKLPLNPVHFGLFPAFRHCRCSCRFDLSLFSSSQKGLGPGKTPHLENLVLLRPFHYNWIFRANGIRPRFLVNKSESSLPCIAHNLRKNRHKCNQ